MRPTSSSVRMTSTPLFLDVPKSCRRSGRGTSSMLPLMVRCWLLRRACATFSSSRFASSPSRGASPAMTLRMLVPMRTRSPSFRRARLIFSPLTKVPLVEPEVLDPDLVALHRDARVLARDHVLDEDHVEIARAADEDLLVRDDGELAALVLAADEAQDERAPSGRGAVDVGALGDGSCISRPTGTSRAMGLSRGGPRGTWRPAKHRS